MITIVLIIHVFIVLALVGVVLMQRSEGGALGIGGGGGGGMMSGRGAANALTRATTVLAGLFFMTSLGLAIFGEKPVSVQDITEELTGIESAIPGTPDDGEVTADDLLESFGTSEETPADATSDDLLTLPEQPVVMDEEQTAEEPDETGTPQ